MLKIPEIKSQANLPLQRLINPNIEGEHFLLTLHEKDTQIFQVRQLVYLHPYVYTSREKRDRKKHFRLEGLTTRLP